MSDLNVLGGSLITGERRDLHVHDGVLVDEAVGGAPAIEASGLLAAPGFVDLQCNGGFGIDLASEPERMWELGLLLPSFGVTAWLPTIVSSPTEVVGRALSTLAEGPPTGWRGAVPLGLHLEGPFLAPARRGAHLGALLQSPSLGAIDGWSRDRGVALVTLAPELPGALEVIHALVERGVVVSLGHSDADAGTARAAIDAGASCVTHLFNAMSPLHHRELGLAGVALTDERVVAGLIADGVHSDPAMVALAQRALGRRLVLVTDAVSALGLPAGQHRLGEVEVASGEEGVRLGDGTLAGSALSMDQAVRNLVTFSGCEPEVALDAASASPAGLLGDGSRGSLDAGSRADVVLLDAELRVVATIVGGEVAHGSIDGHAT